MKSAAHPSDSEVFFITGTDTGAGKTLLTALLACQSRMSGVKALAMKPFCSGGTADVELLDAVQNGELPVELLNPFYFAQPLAPLVAAQKIGRKIRLSDVLTTISAARIRCDRLFIEGAGGLLAPLGEGFSALELIGELNCSVLIAARNRLGVINHVMLTVRVLQTFGVKDIRIILMGCRKPDISAKTNPQTLRNLVFGRPVFEVPYLTGKRASIPALEKNCRKLKKTLAELLECVKTSPVNRTPDGGGDRKRNWSTKKK